MLLAASMETSALSAPYPANAENDELIALINSVQEESMSSMTMETSGYDDLYVFNVSDHASVTILNTSETFHKDDLVEFLVVPEEGYCLADVHVTGVSGDYTVFPIGNNMYAFFMPEESVFINTTEFEFFLFENFDADEESNNPNNPRGFPGKGTDAIDIE